MLQTASWIRRSSLRGATRVRLVCFPHAGGGGSSFNDWTRHLPAEVDLVQVHLPGRPDDTDQVPCTEIGDLIPGLSRQMDDLLDLPIVFYGHSMGAIVAFDLTRDLRRRGARLPERLFVSGRRAPQLLLSRPGAYALEEPALLDYLRRSGGIDERLLVRPAWRRGYLPMLRADLQVSDLYAYRPEPPLPVPIVFFNGQDDHGVATREWEPWCEQTRAGFRSVTLPGGHFFNRVGRTMLIGIVVDELVGVLAALSRREPVCA